MRLSEFWALMERRFGAGYADSYATDQVLPTLGSRTVREALDAGMDAKEVWRAVVAAAEATAR